MKRLMKPSLLLLSMVCGSSAFATLTPSLPRGESIVQIPVPGRANELCVIPTHLPQGDYSAKDLEMEKGLCALQSGVNTALCPKTYSTNPGVEFFLPPAGMTAQQLSAKECSAPNPADSKDNLAKKVAKYKMSVSCSYTPSIIGYYHLSRLLHGAGNVPVAVLRTLDIENHKQIADRGLRISGRNEGTSSIIYQTWTTVVNALRLGAASKKFKDVIFTDAIDQTYAALVQNTKGEEFYAAMFTNARGTETRAQAFRDRNAIMLRLRISAAAPSIVPRQFSQANVQSLQEMKDAADMIVMDTIMSQQDRFGNIDYGVKHAYIDRTDIGSDGFAKMKFKGKMTPQEIAAVGAVPVKIMVIKDNDCGVVKTNMAKNAGLLERVAHIDPKTYKRVLELNRSADTTEISHSFKNGMMFTGADYALVRQNLKDVSASLQTRCRQGSLKLDLDHDAHFSGAALPPQNCEL